MEKKEEWKKEKHSLVVSVSAILLYGTTSLAQTIFNKKILATYDFHASHSLLLLQMVISASILLVLRSFGVLKFPAPNMSTASKILPISICYFATVLLGLVSLPNLSLAMYSALKRLVAFIILICEYLVLQKISPLSIWCSVAVMVFGAAIAGLTDLTFNMSGYCFALSSSAFQALYLVLVKKNASDVSPIEMLFYNCSLSIPFMYGLAIYFDELNYIQRYDFSDVGFRAYFFLAVGLGAFLNFFIFYCTSINSPLTTSITGQAKNILTTFLGVIIFNDLVIHPVNVLGLCVNGIGGVWYAYLKLTTTSRDA
jgi:solute carrier family 35 protein